MRKLITGLCFAMIWMVGTAQAARTIEARSIANYEALKETASATITAELDEEFSPQANEIERLAVPLTLNEEATIHMAQGRTMKGTLRRISPTTLRLDDRTIARLDVSKIDNLRLDAALKPADERQAFLDNIAQRLTKDLDATKQDELNVRVAAAMIKHGFDTSYFRQTVPLAGYFRPKHELGDATLHLQQLSDSSLPISRFKLQNETGQPSLFVAFIGQQPVFGNLPADYEVGMKTPKWDTHTFQVPHDVLKQGNLKLRLFRHDVGAWWLEAGERRKSARQEVASAACLECLGSGTVSIDGAPLLPCPNCDQSGKTDGTRTLYSALSTFIYMDNEEASYTPELAKEMIMLGKRAHAYQEQLTKRLEGIQAKAQAARLEREEVERHRDAEKARQQAAAEARQEAIGKLKSSFYWNRPGQPTENLLQRYMSDWQFDNLNAPSLIQQGETRLPVKLFSDWQRLPNASDSLPTSTKTRLFSPTWRLLWLDNPPADGPEAYLQVMLNVDTTSRMADRLRLKLTLEAKLTDKSPSPVSSTLFFNPRQLSQGGTLLPLTLEQASRLLSSNLHLTTELAK